MLLQGRQGAERAAARLACAIQDMIRVLLVLLQGLRGAERFVVDKTLEGVRLQHSVVLPLALPLCDVPGSHPMLQHGEKGAERAAARWACEVLRVLLVLLQGPRIAEHFVTDKTLEIVPPQHGVVLPLAIPLRHVPGGRLMLLHGRQSAECAAARWACEVLRVLLVLLQGPRIAEHFVTDKTLEIVPPQHGVVLPLALPLRHVPGGRLMLLHGRQSAECAAARWACEVLRV
eukprot:CAMPEP_0176204234 /NCGR_PEP_ID=MMETSP0121_2-20121125/10984_1 /TAXON_ID=160619 /ORGANISM="Kryptoperidinium foliaceum, Strain CCMP 1326" /LENGTH=230 /DNA_ID=CAMNT_0017543151 /DNA_START=175 /DNA_END=863 /DNA_ORIENTATION=+